MTCWPTSWSNWCARPGPSFAGVVLISAHGGNHEGAGPGPRPGAGTTGTPVLVWAAGVRGGDAHAGRTETSLMLAIDPEVVRTELAARRAVPSPSRTLLPRLRAEGVRPVSSNGVLGDPRGASAAEGETLLAAMADRAGRRPRGALAAPGARPHEPGGRASPARPAASAPPPSIAWSADGLAGRGRRRVRRRPQSGLRAGHPGRPGGARHAPRCRRCTPWSATCGVPSDMRGRRRRPPSTVFGGLDAAVAVAGVVSGGAPLWEIGDAQWNVQFDVNVHGVRNLVAAAVPRPAGRARTAPGPGGGGGVGRRAARAPPPERLQRVQARGRSA